jgi:hypothetical protein
VTFPPAVLKLRIAGPGKRGLRLWLPIFVLWPLLPLVLLAGPIAVLTRTPRGRRRGALTGRLLLMAPRLLGVLCSLRGLEVSLGGRGEVVEIAVI